MGPSKAPKSHCLAFYKYDGTSCRAEWHRKRGWCKFGSRTVLIDETSEYAPAINLFKQTYAEPLEKAFVDNKYFRSIELFTAFFEFFGEKSFAGLHFIDDPKEVVLFDICLHKKGILPPRDFIKSFGHLKIPPVVYEGIFNKELVQDVMDGKYPVKEGIVAKGVLGHKQHGLWMAKVKTKWWMEEIKHRSIIIPQLASIATDNIKEQS